MNLYDFVLVPSIKVTTVNSNFHVFLISKTISTVKTRGNFILENEHDYG